MLNDMTSNTFHTPFLEAMRRQSPSPLDQVIYRPAGRQMRAKHFNNVTVIYAAPTCGKTTALNMLRTRYRNSGLTFFDTDDLFRMYGAPQGGWLDDPKHANRAELVADDFISFVRRMNERNDVATAHVIWFTNLIAVARELPVTMSFARPRSDFCDRWEARQFSSADTECVNFQTRLSRLHELHARALDLAEYWYPGIERLMQSTQQPIWLAQNEFLATHPFLLRYLDAIADTLRQRG